MIEEHPCIQNRDWRLQAITTLAEDYHSPYSGQVFPVGSPVEVTGYLELGKEYVEISVPAVPAIYLSQARRARLAALEFLTKTYPDMLLEQPDRLKRYPFQEESQLFDAVENLMATVVFSYIAIEVFANQTIPEDYAFEQKKTKQNNEQPKALKQKDILRFCTLSDKLKKILPDICRVESPTSNRQMWHDFIRLKKLRDRLIHPKAGDSEISGQENAPNHILTWAISPQAQRAPEVALAVILHYLPDDKPRWVKKLEQQDDQAP